MMKYHRIKELVTGTHNDTQQKNGAHLNTGPLDSDAADHCTMWHGTYIHIIMKRILNPTIQIYIWNRTGKNNTIVSPDTLSWPHQLLVCMGLLQVVFHCSYSEHSYNKWYVFNDKMSI